jgi:protein-S-isoprenylcysteine O-methyltransferase Ste14
MAAFIKKFLWFFIIINSGILLVFGISSVSYETILTVNIWRIFGMSSATALVTAGVFSIEPRKPMKRAVNILLMAAHFLSLCAIVFFGGTQFGWFETSFSGFISVIVSVGIVYAFTAGVYILLAKKEAEDLNKALEKYGKEDGKQE